MKKTITLFSIIALGVLAVPVQAHQYSSHQSRIDYLDRVEQRLARQQFQIRQGISSGELTRREARRLREQQHYIVRLTHQFMHDGSLDRYEFRELRKALKHSSHQIHRLKHNQRIRHYRNAYYY